MKNLKNIILSVIIALIMIATGGWYLHREDVIEYDISRTEIIGKSIDKRVETTDILSEEQENHGVFEDYKIDDITLGDLTKKVKNGEAINPDTVKKVLEGYLSEIDDNANVSVTLPLTIIFRLLNNQYHDYEQIILDVLSDKNNNKILRWAMLDIISQGHGTEKTLAILEDIFSDETEDASIKGKCATTLSKNGVDISKELLNRYQVTYNLTEKQYYSRAFANLKTLDAIDLLVIDTYEIKNVNILSTIIQSLSKIAPNDNRIVNNFFNLVELMKNDNQNYSDFEKEVILRQAIEGLSKSDRKDVFDKLLEITKDSTYPNVARSTSIDAFYFFPQFTNNNDFVDSVKKILNDIKNAEQTSYSQYIESKLLSLLQYLGD